MKIIKLSLLGLSGILAFLSLFCYFYKKSGRFRKSVTMAWIVLVMATSVPVEANAKGVDAYTPTSTTQSRPQRGSGLFGRQKYTGGDGPGKPSGGGDDNSGDGLPQCPKVESVEQTYERAERMQELVRKLEEETDSDSESEEDECRLESKASFKELPDGKNFLYNMDQGRGLKNQAKKVWKNPKAKQEVLRMLNRFDDENANIQEKSLKGFKSLTELKNSGPGPRILIYREKNKPPRVIGFCMRNDLDATLAKLKGKYT